MSEGLICTNCGEYAGSPIAERIAHLEAQLADIEEYGTEEINAALTLRQELAKALVRVDELAKAAHNLEAITAAYRLEAMRREDYSHEAFEKHLKKLKGES